MPADKWNRIAEELHLCPQQKRVVELILCGYADKEIVAAMGIGKPTLRTYIHRVFTRLQLNDRVELVAFICARSHGLESSPPRLTR